MSQHLVVLCACLAVALASYESIPPHGRYRYSQDKKNWHEAKAACEAEGATLAIINTHDEAMALKALLRRFPDNWRMTHVGFHDEDEEGTYMTVTGGTLSSAGYNIWKYPPTDSGTNINNDCGAMWTCGRLGDVPCAERHGFICEKL